MRTEQLRKLSSIMLLSFENNWDTDDWIAKNVNGRTVDDQTHTRMASEKKELYNVIKDDLKNLTDFDSRGTRVKDQGWFTLTGTAVAGSPVTRQSDEMIILWIWLVRLHVGWTSIIQPRRHWLHGVRWPYGRLLHYWRQKISDSTLLLEVFADKQYSDEASLVCTMAHPWKK